MQRTTSSTYSTGRRLVAVAFLVALAMTSPHVQAQRAAAPAAPAASVPVGTLDRIRATSRVKLGYREDARPFSFKNQSGQAAGYAVAICQKVADAVKGEPGLGALAVEWVPVTVDGHVAAVQQGGIDLYCGLDAITLARRRDVAFSIPVFPGGVGALLRADAPVRLRDVLSGRTPANTPVWRGNAAQVLQSRTFSVVAGSESEQWLAERARALNVASKVATVSNIDAGVRAVLDRKADAFFAERSVLLDAAKRSPSPGQLVVLDRMFTHAPLALVFARGDDDFRSLVDQTLSRLYMFGEIGGIYATFFGEPDANTLRFFEWNTLPD